MKNKNMDPKIDHLGFKKRLLLYSFLLSNIIIITPYSICKESSDFY